MDARLAWPMLGYTWWSTVLPRPLDVRQKIRTIAAQLAVPFVVLRES
jgi:hypothetical protein